MKTEQPDCFIFKNMFRLDLIIYTHAYTYAFMVIQ